MGNNAPGFQWSGCLLETSDMLCGITAPFRTHGHYKDAPFMGLGYEGLPLSCCAVLCRPLAWPDGGIQRALWLGWPRMSICTWQGGGTEVSFIWHVRYLSRWAWTKRTLQRVSDWPPRLAPPRPATPLLRPSCPGGACRPGRPEGVLGLSRLASAWWCEGRGRGRGPGRPSAPVHPPISRHAEGSRRAVLQYKSAHPLLSTDPHVPTPQQQQEQHTHSPSHTPIHALAGSHTSTAVSKRAIPQPHIGLERRLTSNLLEIQALAQPARPLQPLPSPAFTWLHPPSRTFWLECCTFLRLHPTPRLAYSLRYIHRRYSMYLCIHPHPSSVPSGKVAVMENINDTIHPSQPQAQPFGMVDFGPDAHRQPSQVQYQVGQVPIAQNGHEGHAPWTQGTNPLDYTFWGSCGLPVSTNEAFGYATASFQEAILDSNDYSFPDRYDAVFTSPRPHDIYHDSGASINPQVVSRLHNPANVSHHGLVQPSRQMSFMSEKSSSLPFVDSFEEYAPSSIAGESAYSPGCSPGDESVATYNSSPSESPQPRTPSPLLPSPVSPVSLPTDARGIFDYGAMPDADSIDHYFGAGSDTSETSSTRGKRKRGTRDIGKTAEEIDVEDDELPYAQLIYKALMSVPSRKMVLSEIYEYFRMNIPRFAKPRQKGWQNSIRHNLSMNGVSIPSDLLSHDV
ncbi:hypothetical protein DFH27DRAFT_219091 [Peziza echinospora]|nr:hypothetical protein DFH27DRAFT_219091 [Peziza echinospora]